MFIIGTFNAHYHSLYLSDNQLVHLTTNKKTVKRTATNGYPQARTKPLFSLTTVLQSGNLWTKEAPMNLKILELTDLRIHGSSSSYLKEGGFDGEVVVRNTISDLRELLTPNHDFAGVALNLDEVTKLEPKGAGFRTMRNSDLPTAVRQIRGADPNINIFILLTPYYQKVAKEKRDKWDDELFRVYPMPNVTIIYLVNREEKRASYLQRAALRVRMVSRT